MRNALRDGSAGGPSPQDPQTEEERARREKRCLARLRLGPDAKLSKADKEAEEDLLNTTILVTSTPPPRDASELYTPSNIQLHEEVFVHYPQSALNTPDSGTLAAHSGSLALAQAGGSDGRQQRQQHGRRRSLTARQGGWVVQDEGPARSRRGPIQHEHDHDCCPFTAIRRLEWTLRALNAVRRTSPFDWSHLLSSFSVKNAFMFYPPPPTYGFVRDEEGHIQVRSQTGKRAPRLDHERIEYLRRRRGISDKVPDDLVAGALHGIASAQQPTAPGQAEADSEPSFKLIFIPWVNEVQSYYIRSGSVVFGHRVRLGGPLFRLSSTCPIPCSIIRPHRRMSSHVAIFFHCNGEDIGRPSCLRLLTLANALHMTILVPEYPGYGLFEGSPSEASIKGSMERVVEFLFSSDPSFTPSRLILIGHSIGTGVAVHVAQFINKVFLRLRQSPQLIDQLPYACPVPHGQERASEYAAAVRCPPESTAAPFSAAPAAVSPTEPIPAATPDDPHPLPIFPSSSGAATPTARAAADAHEGRRCSPDKEEGAGHAGRERTPPFLCPHYALGGIILLAPFASIRCVEKWQTLRTHGFSVEELERRRRCVAEDVLVAAPEEWASDAQTLKDTGQAPPSMDYLKPAPLLFDLARYISFNRFPTIDVVERLQEEASFFTYTPLLLLHGAADMLIPAIHSVAIASRVRQSAGGRSAKVYLGFLHKEGHNNLHCSHLTRRFYKDVILLPHLRAQQELRDELEETLRNGLEQSTSRNDAEAAGAGAPAHANVPLASVSPSGSPQMAENASPADLGDGTARADEPAFAAPLQRASLLRSPLSGTTRTTEPIDEEPTNAPLSESPTKQQSASSSSSDDDTSETPLPRLLTEPYLYFIEPASGQQGATWLEKGTFTGPVRIRLLHPPPPRGDTAEPIHDDTQASRPGERDSNIFVTRQAQTHQTRSHGRRPSAAAGEEGLAALPSGRRCVGSGGRSDRPAQTARITEAFEESLRDTLHRTQPPDANFAPAATMLHIALFHNLDHYDVGSIAVASVTNHSIDAAAALEQWRRYRRNHVILRAAIAFFYFSAGSFFISLAICHGVLTHPSKLRAYLPAGTPTQPFHLDARVIIWGVLDGVGYLLLGVVRFYHRRLGLGNLSRHMHTSRAVLILYASCRITAYVLCCGVGIFMAMIIAFTPSHRGGVDWDRWSDLPYRRRVWISYLPRWTMVTSACVHLFFVILIFIKNH